MSNRAVLFLLLFLMLFSAVSGFGRRKAAKYRSFGEQTCGSTVVHRKLNGSDEVAVDPHCNCLLAGFGVVQKIPYMEFSFSSYPIDVRFTSACVRCGMCLAIAGQINQTLLDTYEVTPFNSWINDSAITLVLRTVCNRSFEHYRLREIDNKRFICDRVPGAILIATSADHLWEKNLREMCHGYLDEIGEVQLYKRWQRWFIDSENVPDMATILCKGDMSMTRDCRCIENMHSFALPSKTQHINAKISAHYSRQ